MIKKKTIQMKSPAKNVRVHSPDCCCTFLIFGLKAYNNADVHAKYP
jgi:hypothetical protein